jgi:acyl carrier protein
MIELQGGEMTTLERIEKLFVDKLELNKDLLTPESTLESFGIDSLDKIEFLFALEDEFKIKIPERDVKIDTVQDVVDMVDRLVAEQSANA